MKSKALLVILSFLVAALLLGGCDVLGGGAAADVGTAEHPIKVLFVPSVDVDFIIDNADIVAQAFGEATGLVFEASVPTSYAATIEEICASPTDTIAFLPALAYTLASDYCGVEPGIAAARDGRAVYWSAFIVLRDSDYETLEDLEGASWAYPYPGSSSGFLFPSATLTKAGVTPGEQVETGGHSNTVLAVANGSADFGTVYFSPPQYPTSGRRWEFGDEADVPADLVDSCAPNADGELACGDDFIVNDARASVTDDYPNIVQLVRILALTDDIPNDTLSFGPDFPDDLKQTVMDGVISYVGTDACYQTLCAEKFYEWDEAAPIGDESFDLVRVIRDEQGITIDTIDESE
jgi:phosphonate transport system substrate-binding protein